jgi:RNA polymerase sigma-70 factor (ECF subfamily)
MWAVALRTVRDPEEAADALQDAFISAFRAADKFRAESQVTTWLHRIVVNACLDRIRRRQARPTVPLPETGFNEPATPRDSMAERETSLLVREALDQLPEDQREAFVLKHVEDLSYDEMAEITGAGVSALKMRVKRACERLRDLLEDARHRRRHREEPVRAGARKTREGSRTPAEPRCDCERPNSRKQTGRAPAG